MKRYLYFSSILILALVLFYNIYFRAFPVNFPQFKQEAINIVERKIYNAMTQQVNQQFPNYSSFAKAKVLNSWVREYKKRNKQLIKQEIQLAFLNLKKPYQGENGQTYLMELDCWHWARYVANVCKFGHPGDEVIDGAQRDKLMLAPYGTEMEWSSFIYYFSAALYKAFSLVKQIPLYNFLFYLPLFLTFILIIVIFVFSFYYWGILAAVVSSLFIGMAPIFVARSCAGWFDMEIFNLLLPFLVVWTYLVADSASSEKKRLIWSFFSAFWVGLFCFTWANWWFIFLLIFGFEFFTILNVSFSSLANEEKRFLLKEHILSVLSFVVFSGCWIIIFCGPRPLLVLGGQIRHALTLNEGITFDIWPNVFSTVGELSKPDLKRIAFSVGGLFLFISSLAGLNYLFILQKNSTRFKRNLTLILTFWFLAMFFGCSKGVRFTMFLIIPLGIALGGALDQLFEYVRNKKKIPLVWVASLLVCVFLIKFLNNGYATAKYLYPLINDDWYNLLSRIKSVTAEEAVINTWWDFGDWIKTISERKVIFDGQSQNTPQGYWMARVLLNQSEEEAVAILRMLNNGGNRAFEILSKELKDSFESIFLLKDLLSKTRERAKEDLANYSLPADITDKIIKILYDKPPKAYFLVDSSLEPKIPQISFLGNWDFAKLYLLRNNSSEENKIAKLKKFGIEEERTKSLSQELNLVTRKDLAEWLSGRFQFFSGLIPGEEKDGTIFFKKCIVYQPEKKKVYLYSPQSGSYSTPQSLFVFENGKFEETVYPQSDRSFSVLIIKDEHNYQALVLDRDLVKSLFVRLYFLGGRGLKHFKPFLADQPTAGAIKIFEIDWD